VDRLDEKILRNGLIATGIVLFLLPTFNFIPNLHDAILDTTQLASGLFFVFLGMFLKKYHGSWQYEHSKANIIAVLSGILMVASVFILYLKRASLPFLHHANIFFFTNKSYSILAAILTIALAIILLSHVIFENLTHLFKKFYLTMLGVYLVVGNTYVKQYLVQKFILLDRVKERVYESHLDIMIRVFLLVLIAGVIGWFIERWVQKALTALHRNERNNFSVSFLSFVVVFAMFGLFNIMQYGMVYKRVIKYLNIYTAMYMINLAILAAVFLVLLAIINRFWITSVIYVVFFFIASYATYQKVTFRSEPILPSDLNNIKQIPELISMMGAGPIIGMIIALIALIAVAVFVQRKYLYGPVFKIVPRIIVPIVSAGFIVWVSLGIMNFPDASKLPTDKQPVVTKMLVKAHYKPHMGSLRFNSWTNSPTVGFIGLMNIKAMDEPNGYTKQRVDEIVEKYEKEATKINATRTKELNDQTIIYVLSESYADPRRIPGLKLSENPIPYEESLKKKTTSGLMFSAGYGGGTANMEFEATTSLSLDNFTPAVTTPYVEVVPSMPILPTVVDQFKTKTAIHPYIAAYYNRMNVYKKIGFQHFYHVDSADRLSYDKHLDNSEYISDASAYSEIMKQVNREKGGQYIHVMTMQNHMPYEDDKYKDTVKASGSNFSAASLRTIDTYVQGLKYTDDALQTFIKQLDAEKKPITMVWYGDHLPGNVYTGKKFDNEFSGKWNNIKHQTDYFIYSNKAARGKNVSRGVVTPMMFTPMVMEQTNSKVTPYYALMTEIMEKVPARELQLIMNEKGAFVPESSLTTEQKALWHDLKIIQYDLTNGKHYLKASPKFFGTKR
jgi:phosphoglycerol transferase MdoB-like AlkP superfamily enzyme